jgi:hypothetical protein
MFEHLFAIAFDRFTCDVVGRVDSLKHFGCKRMKFRSSDARSALLFPSCVQNLRDTERVCAA